MNYMQYLYHGIKYLLRIILACIILLVVIGIVQYRFNIPAYVDYLNTRNVREVSIKNPSSFLRLFIPKEQEWVTIDQLLQEEEYDEEEPSTGTIGLDQDFMDFFGDFSQQDVSTAITNDDFGFIDPATQTGDDSSGAMTPEQQRALLLERLRQREARLEQEAMMETGE